MSRDTRGIYDALAERYDRWTALLEYTAIQQMRRRVVTRAEGRVLELAIGTGKNLAHYPRGCQVTGVDFSARSLATAAERAERLGLSFASHVGDVSALPFEDASFDSAVCTLAACTFDDPARVFAELRRVLRPKGQALLVEHVRPRGRLGRLFMDGITPLTVRLLGCHPDRETDATLAQAGFSLTSVEAAVSGLLLGIVAERPG